VILILQICKLFKKRGIQTCADNKEVARSCPILLLCVKPHIVRKVCEEIGPLVLESTLLISIAAGIPCSAIEEWISAARQTTGRVGGVRLIRVMPNTPALVLASASVFCVGRYGRKEDGELVRALFSSVGDVIELNEDQMNAVVGLSGSGPAYVYVLIDALADGGVRSGLPREMALRLAIQTVYGAALMCKQSKEHPAKLKEMVTSPGGTTIAGLHQLEKGRFRGTIMNAVVAGTERSAQLSKL